MKTLPIIFCFWFLVNCSVHVSDTKTENPGDRLPIASQEIASPPRDDVRTDTKQDEFIGCWSSGNGQVMRITDSHILHSTNKFKPIRYRVEGFEQGRLTLRLVDRPQFYFFQEIVSLEMKNSDDSFPLSIKDYRDEGSINTPESTSRSGWTRDECEKWF